MTAILLYTAQLLVLLHFVAEDISQWRGVDRSEGCKSGTIEAEARKEGSCGGKRGPAESSADLWWGW